MRLKKPSITCTGSSFKLRYATAPTVVLLEDVHWADDQSLEALEYLVRQCPNLRLLVLCLARPALFERRAALGQGLPCSTCIELRPLSASDSRRLAEEILQKVDAAPPDLYDLIVERSEGNPFYVEELIKMLIDDRVIMTATDPWRVETHRAAGLRSLTVSSYQAVSGASTIFPGSSW